MEIYKVDGRQIYANRSWINSAGTRHPKTWTRWSNSEKEAAGITTIVLQPFPDDRLYISSHNVDGSVSSTPRTLDGEHGVKSALISQVKQQQGSLLAQTDWAIVRKADKGTAVPTAIQTYRDAIRTKADEMETAITNAANTDAIAALFSGILYDWPKLDD